MLASSSQTLDQFQTMFRASAHPEVDALRKHAFDDFKRQGVPSRHNEFWHYTDLKQQLKTINPLNSSNQAISTSEHIAFSDGTLVGLPSPNNGISFQSLSDFFDHADHESLKSFYATCSFKDPILSLNLALATQGVYIKIAPQTHESHPLIIEHTWTEGDHSAHTLCIIDVGAGADVSLLERFISGSSSQHFSTLIVRIANDAHVKHYASMTGQNGLTISSVIVDANAHSRFHSCGLIASGSLTRRQILTRAQEHCDIALSGLTLARGTQKADTSLILDHQGPHSTSREMFRHIVDQSASATFQGKIIVRPQAQKTDGGMKSHALVLSDQASVNNKPELEIYADDVVCGHGATVAQIDDDQLFYLMSRGIPLAQAQAMLIEAFAADLLSDIKDEQIRADFEHIVQQWMEARHE
jgi:Fe-S cluster assembly protein SufD